MRVPYARFLGKVPFKAVAIVLGAGAAAAFAARAAGAATKHGSISWVRGASAPTTYPDRKSVV